MVIRDVFETLKWFRKLDVEYQQKFHEQRCKTIKTKYAVKGKRKKRKEK